MKIIGADNHDSETTSDILICEKVHESYGKRIVDFLNKEVTNYSPRFYKLVPDDYVLYEWEP